MLRRRRAALNRPMGGAAAVVLMAPLAPLAPFALASAHAETVQPDQVVYDAKVKEDPAAKVCVLALAIRQSAAETVDFRLVVARMKRNDVVSGPPVFGFTIEVRDPHFAPQRSSARPAIEVTSAAFISERYTAAARPRTTPAVDGSWVASTLDTVEGGELVDAAAAGKFQIAYTRTRPSAARVFAVTATPPHDVLSRFSGCIDGLQAIE